MKQDVFWVDAFSAEPFGGNPAVVCVGIDDLSDTQLQHLANEFNVSESVFISGDKGEYFIRWFTPTKELPLVGHATLAAAHVVFSSLARRSGGCVREPYWGEKNFDLPPALHYF